MKIRFESARNPKSLGLLLLTLILILFSSAACGTFEVGIEQEPVFGPPVATATIDQASAQPAVTKLAVVSTISGDTPDETATAMSIQATETRAADLATIALSTPDHTATAMSIQATETRAVELATVTLVPTPDPFSDPLAGLVYSTDEGLWQIDASGEPLFLLDQSDARISPDGSQAVYALDQGAPHEGSDIWLADLQTGERSNLTNTPGDFDQTPIWWPARPGVIIFSWTAELSPGAGYPAMVSVDGNEHYPIDQSEGGPLALSPDGQRIAYGGYDDIGRIYNWDTRTSESFVPALYNASIEKLYQPAWSPDGRYLAWDVGGNNLGGLDGWGKGVVVFDLETQTSRLLHLHQLLGGGSFPSILSWSPDGKWLAYVTFGEGGGRGPSLWAINLNGEDEVYLGTAVDPVWNPDGRWLAYTRTDSNDVWVADTNNWEWQQATFPGSKVVDWISPRS